MGRLEASNPSITSRYLLTNPPIPTDLINFINLSETKMNFYDFFLFYTPTTTHFPHENCAFFRENKKMFYLKDFSSFF